MILPICFWKIYHGQRHQFDLKMGGRGSGFENGRSCAS